MSSIEPRKSDLPILIWPLRFSSLRRHENDIDRDEEDQLEQQCSSRWLDEQPLRREIHISTTARIAHHIFFDHLKGKEEEAKEQQMLLVS